MELRHLRYFVAIAETGNLSRAAEKLYIAQPPLSQQLRQFEEEIGLALFTRHPKGMRLTPEGEALLPQARDILERSERLKHAGQRSTVAQRLSIGYVPSAGSTVLPDLVRRLRRAHPTLELRVHEMITDQQREALLSGRIDAGLARNPERHARLRAVAFLPDPFCLALPATRAKGQPPQLDLRSLSNEPFVAFTRHSGPAYFDRAIRLCGEAGFSPRICHEASTLYGVLDLVHAGLGIALVPATAALLQVRGVAFRALARDGGDEGLSLIARTKDASAVVAELEAHTRALFAALRVRLGVHARV